MSALYRTYRPQDFDEVVGQRHVVRTLRNAVEQGRVRHAYLFAGPRGTGKTSLAKILAKSLNCLESDGPTATPCKHCESCRTIHDATSLDVIELDAASNRGIDDIREIRDRVAMQPALGRYKVYILDEAHSLTTDASNALLKTLEEPPPHVVFVLCTTEPHKLLETIKGRCQSFAFQRPTVDEIGEVLERIAAAEGIGADAEAIGLIARSARGSFRDAVSQLDQLSTATGGQVSADDVRALLGLVDERSLLGLVDAVAAGDAPGALRLIDQLATGGQDLGLLVTDMLGHLRLLMLTRELGTPPASAPLTVETTALMEEQAARVPERLVVQLLEGLLAVLDELRDGGDPRLPLELLVVRTARPAADRSTEAILRRLDALEDPAVANSRPGTEFDTPVANSVPGTKSDTPVANSVPGTKSDTVAAAPAALPELDGIDQLWTTRVLPAVSERKPSLAPHLTVATPTGPAEGVVRLRFPPDKAFQKSFADHEANRAIVAEALSAALGERVRVVLETDTAVAARPNGAPMQPEPAAEETSAAEDEDALLRGFVEELDAHEIEEDDQ